MYHIFHLKNQVGPFNDSGGYPSSRNYNLHILGFMSKRFRSDCSVMLPYLTATLPSSIMTRSCFRCLSIPVILLFPLIQVSLSSSNGLLKPYIYKIIQIDCINPEKMLEIFMIRSDEISSNAYPYFRSYRCSNWEL